MIAPSYATLTTFVLSSFSYFFLVYKMWENNIYIWVVCLVTCCTNNSCFFMALVLLIECSRVKPVGV